MQTDVLARDLANSVGLKKLMNTTWEIVGGGEEQCEKVSIGTQSSGEGESCEEDQTILILEGENWGHFVEGRALQGHIK